MQDAAVQDDLELSGRLRNQTFGINVRFQSPIYYHITVWRGLGLRTLLRSVMQQAVPSNRRSLVNSLITAILVLVPTLDSSPASECLF